MEYSFSFSEELQSEWAWSEVMAGQPEILDYANHIADRFDLRRDIQFNTKVTSARFDEKIGFGLFRRRVEKSSLADFVSWRQVVSPCPTRP